ESNIHAWDRAAEAVQYRDFERRKSQVRWCMLPASAYNREARGCTGSHILIGADIASADARQTTLVSRLAVSGITGIDGGTASFQRMIPLRWQECSQLGIDIELITLIAGDGTSGHISDNAVVGR